MALTSLGSLGSGNNKVSGASWNTVTTTQALNAGDFVLLAIASDNIGTADAYTNTHTAVSIGGKALVKIDEGTKGGGAVAGGATLSVWRLVLDTGLPSGSVIACTFSAATVAKALAAWRFGTSGPGAQVVMDGAIDGFTLTQSGGLDEDNTGQTRRERLYWCFNAIEATSVVNNWNVTTTNPTGGIGNPFDAATTTGGSAVTNIRLAGTTVIGTFDKVVSTLATAITGDTFYIDGSMYEIPGGPQTFPVTASDTIVVSDSASRPLLPPVIARAPTSLTFNYAIP